MNEIGGSQPYFSQGEIGDGNEEQFTPGGGGDESMNDNEEGDFDISLEEDEAPPMQPPNLTDLFSQFLPQPTFTQLISQPLAQPTPQPKPTGSTRWELVDDIAMISAIMNTSCDAAVGTNQKGKVMWGKVVNAYEEARAARPYDLAPRTLDMIKGRWNRMAPFVLKWAGAYDEAKRRKQSGTNDAVVVREAYRIYESKWGKFSFFEQWKVMRQFRKWRSVVKSSIKNPPGRPRNPTSEDVGSIGTGSSGKRSRGDYEESPDPDTPTSVPDVEGSTGRPGGAKQAKAKLKGKKVSEEALETLQSFNSRLQLSSETRERIEMEKLEMQRQKEARRQRQQAIEEYRMKFDMLQTLQQKSHLLPWEEKMVNDLNTYFNNFTGFD